MAHQARAYPRFCTIKRLEISPSPRWNAFRKVTSALNSPVPTYTPVRGEARRELRVLPKSTTQCPWAGLQTGSLDPGKCALTIFLTNRQKTHICDLIRYGRHKFNRANVMIDYRACYRIDYFN